VEAADVVIVCLSKSSVTKEGYVQKEVRKVLDISLTKPDGTIFVIPLRLEECEIPRRLADWHYADYFPVEHREATYKRLIESLKVRIGKRNPLLNQTNENETRKIVAPQHRSDHHSALLSEQISKASASGVNFIVAKLQWGKYDIGYSLHAEPSSYSSYGMQTTDLLYYLGFERESCSFVIRRECYAAWVDSEFNVAEFAAKFGEAISLFEKAARLLESCGQILDQPEGWGYFYSKSSHGRSGSHIYSGGGDGHTSNKPKIVKESEDDYFYYKLSWIENENTKGWTFHYRFKDVSNQYLSPALSFLRINQFKECPFFKFEECFWTFIEFQSRGDSYFDSNVEFVNRAFDSNQNNFPLALQMLIQVHSLLLPFGFRLLKA